MTLKEIADWHAEEKLNDYEFVVQTLRKIPVMGIQAVFDALPAGRSTGVFVEWLHALTNGGEIWHPQAGYEPVSEETMASIRSYLASKASNKRHSDCPRHDGDSH